MMNSKTLFAQRQELANRQSDLMSEGKTDDALVVQGQIEQLDTTLQHVLDEEEELRAQFTAPKTSLTLAEAVLGSRDEFQGIGEGFKATVGSPMDYDAGIGPNVVTVSAPTEIDLTIPGKSPMLLDTFATTLPSVPAKGSVSFKQRSAQYGSPDTWEGVVDGTSAAKQKVVYTWVDAVANKEAIAGYVPISKDSMKDYDELASIVQSDLLIDLNEKRNSKFVSGNNTSGIVGIMNIPGILQFGTSGGMSPTPGVDVTYNAERCFEAIRKMRTKVMKMARRIPTHVAVNPGVKTALDLHKTSDGYYQILGQDMLWGMQVVEDFDVEGIVVYDSFAAKQRPVHGLTIEVGTINDQFIHNELCILAEETTCLQVVYPDAFCYAPAADLQ